MRRQSISLKRRKLKTNRKFPIEFRWRDTTRCLRLRRFAGKLSSTHRSFVFPKLFCGCFQDQPIIVMPKMTTNEAFWIISVHWNARKASTRKMLLRHNRFNELIRQVWPRNTSLHMRKTKQVKGLGEKQVICIPICFHIISRATKVLCITKSSKIPTESDSMRLRIDRHLIACSRWVYGDFWLITLTPRRSPLEAVNVVTV